jgi:hypothetical protein
MMLSLCYFIMENDLQISTVRRQRRAITPYDSERLIANVFHTVLLPKRGIKGGLRTDFPLTFAFDHDLCAPADKEKDFFGFIMLMVRNHAADLGDVHAHRDIANSPKFWREQEL